MKSKNEIENDEVRVLMTYLPRTLARVLNVAIDHLLFGGGALAMEDRLPVRSEVEKININRFRSFVAFLLNSSAAAFSSFFIFHQFPLLFALRATAFSNFD